MSRSPRKFRNFKLGLDIRRYSVSGIFANGSCARAHVRVLMRCTVTTAWQGKSAACGRTLKPDRHGGVPFRSISVARQLASYTYVLCEDGKGCIQSGCCLWTWSDLTQHNIAQRIPTWMDAGVLQIGEQFSLFVFGHSHVRLHTRYCTVCVDTSEGTAGKQVGFG